MYYFTPPDAFLLGRENQREKVDGFEVTCHGCGHKDAVESTEDSIFEAEQGAL